VIDWSLGLSYRKIKQKLEFLYGVKVAISSIHSWVKSFQEKVGVPVDKKERTQIAIDETVVKSRDRRLYLWSAIDLKNGELVAFDVSVGRSELDAMLFLYKIKVKCKGKLPVLVTDKGPWYNETINRVGFDCIHNAFSIRNPIEQFFKLVKDRTRVFYNNLNTKKGVKHLLLFMKMFVFWYRNIRMVIS
jgi:transposase-like protein